MAIHGPGFAHEQRGGGERRSSFVGSAADPELDGMDEEDAQDMEAGDGGGGLLSASRIETRSIPTFLRTRSSVCSPPNDESATRSRWLQAV